MSRQHIEDFHAKVQAFTKANPGLRFVIRSDASHYEKPRMEAARKAWFSYLSVNNLPTVLATWQMVLRDIKTITVVAENPEHFDQTYVRPDQEWRDPVEARHAPNPAILEKMKKLAEELDRKSAPVHRRNNPLGEAQNPRQAAEQWLEEQRANPQPVAPLSAASRQRMGLPPHEASRDE